MTLVLGLALVLVVWFARPPRLLSRDRGDHVSDRWLRDHVYDHGQR